jgi:hypothetical protein
MAERIDWQPLLTHAAALVRSYDTGVTLRQLFYRLATAGLLPNLRSYYRRLSEQTAKARRAGTFPDLIDRTSRIEQPRSFTDWDDAQTWIRDIYRRDRTAGQEWTIYLGVEKDGMSEQLDAWFTDPLGIPHVALGGYASQTLADHVGHDIVRQGRPAVLIYAGDLDPTGEDIDRDFEERVGVFDKVVRVALDHAQVEEYDLIENTDPEVAAKVERDPRAAGFLRRHRSLVQYEVDALDPQVLRDLYRDAIGDFWDASAYEAVMELENDDLGGA